MKRFTNLIYQIVRFFVRLFYPKMEVVGLENLPQEPCIIVSNHCQMNGPIATELYFPDPKYIWCAGEMMHLKEVPAYAYRDFWQSKPTAVRWLYKLLSYLIAPLSVCIFNNAHTIAVYHDRRLISTFRDTLARLKEGSHVIIFPEQDGSYDHILCQFQEGFVDVAKSYHKQTGKTLSFVPMYLCPDLHKMYLGHPIPFCPETPIKEERHRICQDLMAAISAIAQALPRHTVVPYRNISRKRYPCNIAEENAHESPCR